MDKIMENKKLVPFVFECLSLNRGLKHIGALSFYLKEKKVKHNKIWNYI